MAEDYPYMVSNNKIAPIFEKIEQAEKPTRFTHEFLKKLGFSSSNDRAIIPLLKRLEFLTENGSPTEIYNDLKDKSRRPYVLAERMRDLYSDLFSINTTIHTTSEDEIKGAISRVTGKDAKSVNRYYATFKALANLAKFAEPPIKKKPEKKMEQSKPEEEKPNTEVPGPSFRQPGFHYNIQIHLPATTDISVYNAIFKSLKDNLLI